MTVLKVATPGPGLPDSKAPDPSLSSPGAANLGPARGPNPPAARFCAARVRQERCSYFFKGLREIKDDRAKPETPTVGLFPEKVLAGAVTLPVGTGREARPVSPQSLCGSLLPDFGSWWLDPPPPQEVRNVTPQSGALKFNGE